MLILCRLWHGDKLSSDSFFSPALLIVFSFCFFQRFCFLMHHKCSMDFSPFNDIEWKVVLFFINERNPKLCGYVQDFLLCFRTGSRVITNNLAHLSKQYLPSVTNETKECRLCFCFWEKPFPDSGLLGPFCRPFSPPSVLIIQLQWEDSLLLNKTMTSLCCTRPCSASPVCLDLVALSLPVPFNSHSLPWTLHSHTHIWKHSCQLIMEWMKYFWTSRPQYGQ